METSDTVRHYADEEVDISYDAHRCIHAAESYAGSRRCSIARAVDRAPSAASAGVIANVIAKCPSGALHLKRRDGGPSETPQEPTTIVPTPGGPVYLRGLLQLRPADG